MLKQLGIPRYVGWQNKMPLFMTQIFFTGLNERDILGHLVVSRENMAEDVASIFTQIF